ncbi:MAG: hypothetical protein J6N77_04320 [Lachnospiraceae bacterium]|nr:hypothetical protein [Lachnospiraceae bacterium]
MAEQQAPTLFRKKAMESISSPEDLTSYLRVTSPGMWIILAAVIVLLMGILAWSAVGTLETTVDATAVVHDHEAKIVATGQGAETLEAGMPLRIASQEYIIAAVDLDEYGRVTANTEVPLPNGTYEAKIVIEQIQPIKFLLESR